jgi:hypothetical protein
MQAGKIMARRGFVSKDDLRRLSEQLRAYRMATGPFSNMSFSGLHSLKSKRRWWESVEGLANKRGDLIGALALQLLNVVPNSAAVERVFSLLKGLQAPRRSRMHVTTYSMLAKIKTQLLLEAPKKSSKADLDSEPEVEIIEPSAAAAAAATAAAARSGGGGSGAHNATVSSRSGGGAAAVSAGADDDAGVDDDFGADDDAVTADGNTAVPVLGEADVEEILHMFEGSQFESEIGDVEVGPADMIAVWKDYGIDPDHASLREGFEPVRREAALAFGTAAANAEDNVPEEDMAAFMADLLT